MRLVIKKGYFVSTGTHVIIYSKFKIQNKHSQQFFQNSNLSYKQVVVGSNPTSTGITLLGSSIG